MATIKYPMTLSTTEPYNYVGKIKVRQADDNTQIFQVTVTENGQPKSFAGLTPFFCLLPGEVTGQGVSEEPVTSYNASAGTLEYTLSPNALQFARVNEAYFSFRKELPNGKWIEQFSTKSFFYTVEKSIYTQPFKDSNYWFTFSELYRKFQQYIEDGKTSWEQFVEQNREIIESVDPGGKVLTELIEARKSDEGDDNGFGLRHDSLSERLSYDNKSNFLFGINVTRSTVANENFQYNYVLTEIPLKDQNNDIVKIKQKRFEIENKKTAREFANEQGNLSVVTNAGMASPTISMGTYVIDGKDATEGAGENYMYTLAFDDKNNLKYYEPNTAASTIIADGFKNAFAASSPIVWEWIAHEKGIKAFDDWYKANMPLQIICQKADKQIFL